MIVHEETPFSILVVDTDDHFCCKDYDDECVEVVDKPACWKHYPENGICPYLGD